MQGLRTLGTLRVGEEFSARFRKMQVHKKYLQYKKNLYVLYISMFKSVVCVTKKDRNTTLWSTVYLTVI